MEYIEIAKFKLREGITSEAFIMAEKKVREGLIKEEPGFISRELCCDDKGHWLMQMRFQTKVNMDKWLNDLKLDPAMKKLSEMIDFTTMRIEFFNKQI